jgi:hypothetical protein
MAPPPQSARGSQERIQVSGITPGGEKKIQRHRQCSLPVRRSASGDDTRLSHDVSSAAADMSPLGPAPSHELERR